LIVVQKTRSMGFSGQLASVLNQLGLAWWIEVTTQSPTCVYYFGPFTSAQEAQEELPGYLEDLGHEGAQSIQASVKRCKPAELTIFEDADFSPSFQVGIGQPQP
jgi:hypothetical protein